MQNLFDPERHCGSPSASQDGAPCRRDKGTGTDHFGSGVCRSHEPDFVPRTGPVVFDATRHCGAETHPLNGATPCRNAKGWMTMHPGAGHCKLHLGSSPNGIKHAQKEQAEAVVAKLGLPTGTGDPFALLEKAVRYAEGYLEATAQLLVEVVEKTRTDVSLEAAAGIHVRAIRQGATTGNQAVEANVADRQAKIGEQLGKVVVLAVQAALDRAGVAGDMRILAEAAAAEILDVRLPVGAELN